MKRETLARLMISLARKASLSSRMHLSQPRPRLIVGRTSRTSGEALESAMHLYRGH